MGQFRVLKRSTKERIYVDKINPREHLHVTGSEFTDSMIKQISLQNGSNTFKKEEKEPEKVIEEPVESIPEKKLHWKQQQKLDREAGSNT